MNIQVLGFRAYIESVEETLKLIRELECTLQLLDARGVAGRDHVIHGTLHAINAIERGYSISNDPGIEICLRVAGVRQINKALDLLGISEGEMEICAVLVDCPEDTADFLESLFERDDSVLEPDYSYLKNLYGMGTEAELVGVKNALIERTTMLILTS